MPCCCPGCVLDKVYSLSSSADNIKSTRQHLRTLSRRVNPDAGGLSSNPESARMGVPSSFGLVQSTRRPRRLSLPHAPHSNKKDSFKPHGFLLSRGMGGVPRGVAVPWADIDNRFMCCSIQKRRASHPTRLHLFPALEISMGSTSDRFPGLLVAPERFGVVPHPHFLCKALPRRRETHHAVRLAGGY